VEKGDEERTGSCRKMIIRVVRDIPACVARLEPNISFSTSYIAFRLLILVIEIL
jgi:hypothetical protein